jgi:heat shock protein HslJ
MSIYGRINLRFGAKIFSKIHPHEIRTNQAHILSYTGIPLTVTIGYLLLLYGGPGMSLDPAPTVEAPAAVPSAEAPVLRARGNEPFWSLEIRADSIVLRTPEDAPLAAPRPRAEAVEGGRRFAAGPALVVTVLDQYCADGMSGMPYPLTVIVEARGAAYRGCGGEPTDLLTGAEWLVEDIGGAGVVDRSHATLKFTADGTLAGETSCNSYSTSYTLTGEGLRAGEIVMTRRACAPALMDQETRFVKALEETDRFEVDATGALILFGMDRQRILARRPYRPIHERPPANAR